MNCFVQPKLEKHFFTSGSVQESRCGAAETGSGRHLCEILQKLVFSPIGNEFRGEADKEVVWEDAGVILRLLACVRAKPEMAVMTLILD